MSEESLKLLSIDDICVIMIKAIEDYNLMEKLKQHEELKQKRDELYVLYKVINEKRAQGAAH